MKLSIRTDPRYPVAQTLLTLTQGKEFSATLTLIEQMAAGGWHTIDTLVKTEDGESVPLHGAMMQQASKGEPSDFHKADTALRLAALVPDIFAGPDTLGTTFWAIPIHWSKQYKEQKNRWNWTQLDEWLDTVIRLLPHSAITGRQADEGWKALLTFPCPRALRAISERNHGQWTRCNTHGEPWLKEATAKEVWEVFLANGGDPWAPQPDGRPFWQGVLTKARSTIPKKDTFAEAVETWVSTTGVENDAPARKKEALDFLCQDVSARIGQAEWVKKTLRERIQYLMSLPTAWVHNPLPAETLGLLPEHDSIPTWLAPFFVNQGEDASGWGQALRGIKPLREELGPVLSLVIWIIEQRNRRDSEWIGLTGAPQAVLDGARSEQAITVGNGLVALWETCWDKKSQGQWLFLGTSAAARRTVQAIIFEQTLAKPGVTRPAPRL